MHRNRSAPSMLAHPYVSWRLSPLCAKAYGQVLQISKALLIAVSQYSSVTPAPPSTYLVSLQARQIQRQPRSSRAWQGCSTKRVDEKLWGCVRCELLSSWRYVSYVLKKSKSFNAQRPCWQCYSEREHAVRAFHIHHDLCCRLPRASGLTLSCVVHYATGPGRGVRG